MEKNQVSEAALLAMEDIHFIAVDSLNFAIGGALNDVILTAHRFMMTYENRKLQSSFPNAVTTGFEKSLGRRAIFFGKKQDLELFWEINGEEIEQTCTLISPSGIPVRSLDKLVRNQPQTIAGYGIFSRYRIRNQKKLMDEAIKHRQSKGFPVDEKEIADRIKKRIAEAPKTIESISLISKTDNKPITLNVATKRVEAKAPYIDLNTISSYGLSTTNLVPILHL